MARAAMDELEGIETLRMNGVRATFTLVEGATFDEQAVAAAFAKHELQLDTFAKLNTPRPQTMRRYTLKSGLG